MTSYFFYIKEWPWQVSVEYEFIDILMNVNKFQIYRGFAESEGGGG